MKISINPMSQLIKRAERRINLHCMVTPQDLAHDRKRTLALSVLTGSEPTAEFEAAADIEGATPIELANVIASKPDVMMAKENARRSLIVQVRAAKTPDEVAKIIADNGVAEHVADKIPELI